MYTTRRVCYIHHRRSRPLARFAYLVRWAIGRQPPASEASASPVAGGAPSSARRGRDPPFPAVRRPAHPCRSATRKPISCENAKGS
jgi:hypothetical protein